MKEIIEKAIDSEETEGNLSYEEKALRFLRNSHTLFNLHKSGMRFSNWNKKQKVMTYLATFKRGDKEEVFEFFDSINNTENNKKPSAYDILACLQKYDAGSLDDFADEFGYSGSGMKISEIVKLHFNVCEEYKKVLRLWGDKMEELEEIQ